MTEPTIMGIKTALLVSAGTGGAVAIVRARGPWWARLASGFAGAACSYYWTPILAPVAEVAMEQGIRWAMGIPLDLDSTSVFGALGFLIGATGLEIMQLFTDVLRGKRSLGDIVFLRSKAQP
jgi:hypothetical protein